MVIGCTLGDKNETSKVSFSFSSEMRPGEWVACILEYIFIKFFVLFLFDLIFISNPKRLVLVNSLEFDSINISSSCSINWIFNLFLIEFFSFLFPLFSDFLDLSLDFGFCLFYFLFSCNYLFEINGIVNEATVSFNQSLQFIIFTVLSGIFFQI